MTLIVQEGTILMGKYRVEKLLGEGAMGYVVAARHEFLGELHALKLMQPEALKSAEAVERFMREARAYARLKSDHAVHVHDFGRLDDGAPFIAMEYLEGQDLQNVLDHRKVFPFHEAASYVLQACDAIAEAHALGIVHRDLKPSNLFLTRRSNGTPCVKVLDFGISKALDDTASSSPKLTATNTVMGTAYYMSPEQVRNSKATDHRGDIWALGVILYEFATGNVPFGGENFFDISSGVVNGQPIPPSQVRPGIPLDFDYVVSRCLEKFPEMRYQSIGELMAALQPLAAAGVVSNVASNPEFNGPTRVHVDAQVDVDKDTATITHPSDVDDSKETLKAASITLESAIPTAFSDDQSNNAASSYAQRFLRDHNEKLETQRIKRRRELARKMAIAVLAVGALIGCKMVYDLEWNLPKWRAVFRGTLGLPSATASASFNEPPAASETAPLQASASPAVSTSPHRGVSKTKAVTNTVASAGSPKSAPSTDSSAAAQNTGTASSTGAPSSSAKAPSSSVGAPLSSTGAPSSSAKAPSSSVGGDRP